MPKSKEQHLAELPKKKFKIMNLVWVVIMVLGLFLSVNVTNTHISVLFNNFSQFTDIFVQMCHPDWGYAATAVPVSYTHLECLCIDFEVEHSCFLNQ